MRKLLLAFLAIHTVFYSYSQSEDKLPENPQQVYFNNTYQKYKDVPKGILEAIAFTQTRFEFLDGTQEKSCIGLPTAYTAFGLIKTGQNYFKNTLAYVSLKSGIAENSILTNPQKATDAFAKAYLTIKNEMGVVSNHPQDHIPILVALSEIPYTKIESEYALQSHLYAVYSFLDDPNNQKKYGFPDYHLDFGQLFGGNLAVLSAPYVKITPNGIYNQQGNHFNSGGLKSPDYPPAIWDPAPSCNYSNRGTAVTHVTIHTVQGSYAGAISWAKNCSSNVSYHYVIRSSDGQITQMVYESIKAWHVGSENPYTIGYEHEGYVSNPAWYTTAMYNASAALSLDVTQNTTYGISPLRTYYGPSSSGTNTLGSCTRIKGHQHYPNQSHTDPGINWDWERYYRLINGTPTPTTLTTNSGNFYDSGGSTGNYGNDERSLTLISPTGANSVTLNFSAFNLETNYDYLFIYDGNNVNASLIGKYTGTNSPGTITSSGNSLLVEFRSDCGVTNPGWAASWTSSGTPNNPSDTVAPTSSISVAGNWQTQDFNSTFTDADIGKGVYQRFYQVIHNNNIDWRANANNGFFSDNFNGTTIHPDWTSVTGTWINNSGFLEQTDENLGNTNIYTNINQDSANGYLYHWAGNISGVGSSRRAGFHFMCDSAQLTNRGNSYFVWFRVDDNKIQIYKVVNDVFSLMSDLPFTYNANQWYDVKVTFSKTSGEIDVYLNNSWASGWVDPTPHTKGNAISFRSGNAKYTVNNMKVYKTRSSNEIISIGSAQNDDVPYENYDPYTPSCRIKSIVTDSVKNISNIFSYDVNVDWTPPSAIDTINDGLSNDISVTYTQGQLSANWSNSVDTNSAIGGYHYSIGTSPLDTSIVGWTYNWAIKNFTHTGLNLVHGQTYYVNIRAENGAGILGPIISSNGQTFDSTSTGIDEYVIAYKVYPNPVKDNLIIEKDNLDKIIIQVFDMNGRLVLFTEVFDKKSAINMNSLSKGVYQLKLTSNKNVDIRKIVKQ